MAFKPSSQSPNMPKVDYTADASTSFTQGSVGYRDTSTGEIKEDAGGGEATTLTIECVIAKTETSAASNPTINAYPIISGPGQLWIADCTNNTASNQLNKAHALTSATAVANTSTTDATTAGVFVALKQVGAASDKKLLGYFVKVGQVTA